MSDDHRLLGVRPGASLEEIRRAWRERAKVLHPDVGGDAREFKRVRAAYERLISAPRKQRVWSSYGRWQQETVNVGPTREDLDAALQYFKLRWNITWKDGTTAKLCSFDPASFEVSGPSADRLMAALERWRKGDGPWPRSM